MTDLEEIEELQQVLKKDSSNFQARRRLAILLLDSGFTEEALKQFQFLVSIFPTDASLFYNIGIVYEKLKKFDNAEQSYIKAIEFSPDETDFYYNLGLVYIEKNEYDKAISCFKKVLATDVDDSNSYFNLGICFLKKKNDDYAMKCFRKAVELNDNDFFCTLLFGVLLQKTRQH